MKTVTSFLKRYDFVAIRKMIVSLRHTKYKIWLIDMLSAQALGILTCKGIIQQKCRLILINENVAQFNAN
jgi:hypothetical protein